MNGLNIYPEKKEQLSARKVTMKALKITFEQRKKIYPNRVLDSVKESLQQVIDNKLTPYKGVKEMLDVK